MFKFIYGYLKTHKINGKKLEYTFFYVYICMVINTSINQPLCFIL